MGVDEFPVLVYEGLSVVWCAVRMLWSVFSQCSWTVLVVCVTVVSLSTLSVQTMYWSTHLGATVGGQSI